MGEIKYPYPKLKVVSTTPLHEDLFNNPDDQIEGLTERIGGTWDDATRPTPSVGVPHPVGWNTDEECYEYWDGFEWTQFYGGSGGGGGSSVDVLYNCAAEVSVNNWVAQGENDTVILASATDKVLEAIGIVVVKPISTIAKVRLLGRVDGFSGLAAQDRLFLSTIAGEHIVNPIFDPMPPLYKIIQRLGIAKNTTEVIVAPNCVVEIE